MKPSSSGSLSQFKWDINVTPLVDILLVLLVIFMMVTPILTTAMDSNIPQRLDPAVAPPIAEQQIVLRVDPEGRCTLNDTEVEHRELIAQLRERFARKKGRRLMFVDADDALPYGAVVQIMDLCRSAGAQNIGVLTQP